MKKITAIAGTSFFAAASVFAMEVAAEDLTVGLAAIATSADPHFHRAGYNFDLRENISDALAFASGVTGELEPRLARSWEIVEDTKWIVTLEGEARFASGKTLGADDVIYSFCRVRNVPNSPGLYSSFVSTIASLTDLGDGRLEIATKAPDPNLMRNLSNIGIVENPTGAALTYDDETCGNDNWLSTNDFNSGQTSAGIGHYKIRTFVPDVEIVIERNEDYYGTAAAYETVTIKALPDNSARIAALLGGSVDVINAVPINGVESIQADADLQLVSAPSTLAIFFLADQGQEPTPKVTGTDGKNPFLDVRVRKALNLAINRAEIAETVMGGMAQPANQLIVGGVFGHNPELREYRYNPLEARELLAEAGYPDGFGLTLTAPADRYVNGAQVAQAVAAMLAQIGIDVTLETFPRSVYFEKASAFEYSLYLAGAAADTGEGLSLMFNLAATRDSEKGWGGANRGRYSNPATDALLVEAQQTLDDAAREELLRQASAQVYEDEGYIPLYHEFGVWAARGDVSFEPHANLVNIFYTAHPKN